MKISAPFCYLFLTLFLLSTIKTKAQDYQSEVRLTVDKFFDGMRSGDSAAVRSIILPGATLSSVLINANDSLKADKSSFERFIKAIGTPHKEIWDERIYDVKILTDGPMATVWAPYKFYLGDKFSHCGVNVFLLGKDKAGWKILQITDTRRKTDYL
ncbi:nuclear transport factor 2 family protein [Dyadobacter psychrotolerans]|uniref:Nuclear transport factor 2 family protein n=1 Tax=Dyadobacter psychrotolerans TaxID=2541721 RepID=A0A4R5DNT2_9BACT|nr:nuclear transport factor 2 family protein [Dyadobacter psychrotolerans]TDE12373.1 hypothetical protein E0F88_22000 [Dyadobacter psychrotolerans]